MFRHNQELKHVLNEKVYALNDHRKPFGEQEAIQVLCDAKDSGRPIVPLLGAGISAGSGFPLVESLRQYLLKVRFFIQYGAFRDALQFTSESNPNTTAPERNPSRYLTDFGWPNPNQLNSDIHRTQFGNGRPDFEATLRAAERAIGKSFRFGDDREWIDYFVVKSLERSFGIDFANQETEKVVQQKQALKALRKYKEKTRHTNGRWGLPRWKTKTAALFAQLEDIRLYDRPLADSIEEEIWKLELSPTSDWSRQLMQLTEGNSTLIDALASTLGLRYAPGLSHRMMAQIVRTLGLNLLLTINFDSYLEMAFAEEGLSPRVIDVSRDDAPPDLAVVRQALTIVKLHGTSHSIRLGERLDYALDDDTRQRVERFVGNEALLLIIGFSGYERRMMQLIDHLTIQTSQKLTPRVLWMHFEPDERLPATLVNFRNRLVECGKPGLLKTARLSDAGEFLFHWFQKSTSTYPRVRVPVTILPKRILILESQNKTLDSLSARDTEKFETLQGEAYLHLFIDSEDLSAPPPLSQTNSNQVPSIALSAFARANASYDLIWIDLEEHHTVAGVITEIIDRMRVFDPDLSPLVLPVEGDVQTIYPRTNEASREAKFDKAVRFLHRALRRGRYFIAFDSLEDFGREHTSHHGLPSDFTNLHSNSLRRKRRLLERVEDLSAFLRVFLQLNGHSEKGTDAIRVSELDWFCGIACCAPQARHSPRFSDDSRQNVLGEVTACIESLLQLVMRRNPLTVDLVTSSQIGRNRKPPKGNKSINAVVYVANGKKTSPRFDFTRSTLKSAPEAQDPWTESQLKLNQKISKFINSAMAVRSGDPVKWTEVDPDAEVAFLALSIARRPRSYVMIQEVWGEYLAPNHSNASPEVYSCVKKWLAKLEHQQKLMFMPGGFYWIGHSTHRSAYKELTEPVRRKYLNYQFFSGKKVNPQALEQSVSRLFFLINFHGSIARFYYLHVFQRTHDSNGVFEYFYHRVTSIKYLASLCSLLSVNSLALATEEQCSRIRQEALFLLSCESIDIDLQSFASANIAHILKAIVGVRNRLVRGLANAFERENETVFSIGSSDTWLAWIEQLLEHDLDRFLSNSEFHFVMRAPKGVDTNIGERTGEFGREGIELVFHLRRLLEDLEASLLRERRDWELCASHRIKHLQDSSLRIADWFESQVERQRGKRPFAKLLSYCQILRAFQRKSKFEAISGLMDTPQSENDASLRLAQMSECALEFQGAGSKDTLLRELTLFLSSLTDIARCIHHHPTLMVDRKKITISDSPQILLSVAEKVVTALHRAVNGTKGVQSHLDHHGVELRSLLDIWQIRLTFEQMRLSVAQLDPWNGTILEDDRKKALNKLCNRLESTIQKTRGAHVIDPLAFCLRRCELRTVQARILIYLGQTVEAQNELMNAETGLTDQTLQQRFQLAIVAELRAQAFMKEADKILTKSETNDDSQNLELTHSNCDSIQTAQRKAHGRLGDARQSLIEAEELLQRGRRSTGQWLRLNAAKAQLEIEYLLLRLFKMQDESNENEVEEELQYRAQLYNGLYRGVEAIRGGWDCIPSTVGEQRSQARVYHQRASPLARSVVSVDDCGLHGVRKIFKAQ